MRGFERMVLLAVVASALGATLFACTLSCPTKGCLDTFEAEATVSASTEQLRSSLWSLCHNNACGPIQVAEASADGVLVFDLRAELSGTVDTNAESWDGRGRLSPVSGQPGTWLLELSVGLESVQLQDGDVWRLTATDQGGGTILDLAKPLAPADRNQGSSACPLVCRHVFLTP